MDYDVLFGPALVGPQVAEERLNRQLAMQAKKSKELNELNAKNQELIDDRGCWPYKPKKRDKWPMVKSFHIFS